MRILALDHGTKRIGVALSDETATIAQPLEFIPAEPFAKVLQRIKEIVIEKQVREVVVGLPRNMNGTYGPAAESARKFAATLREALGIPVKTWDERLTTVQANRFLIEAGHRREQRKTKVDQSAAAILLQSYLEASAARSENPGNDGS
ncbi:MAG: Holliday junction resolvase RuvX [Verrucomicrobiota bacterium]|jgi:putative Holliday junction resolvase